MTPAPAQNPPEKYALPLVAMILSIVGVCICPTALVGGILGIVAWVRISKEPHLPGKGFAIAATLIPVALIPIAGIYAAIAIPNFIKFQARSKQSECKVQLKTIYTAQKMLHTEGKPYTDQLEELGLNTKAINRYSYFLNAAQGSPVMRKDSTTPPEAYAAALKQHGIKVGVSEDGFTAACVGNIDNDPTLDIWTISTEDSVDADGIPVPAGMPVNVVNDVRD